MKSAGANIWAQDEASCVIYGMPMAVIKAGYADEIIPLKDLGPCLSTDVS
jgi:two-component system, chemotaxis family, protein-glutamate methylesterase/glutaminase